VEENQLDAFHCAFGALRQAIWSMSPLLKKLMLASE
jgi:hypothetical protein